MGAVLRLERRENPAGRKKIQASGLIFMLFFKFLGSIRRFSIDCAGANG